MLHLVFLSFSFAVCAWCTRKCVLTCIMYLLFFVIQKPGRFLSWPLWERHFLPLWLHPPLASMCHLHPPFDYLLHRSPPKGRERTAPLCSCCCQAGDLEPLHPPSSECFVSASPLLRTDGSESPLTQKFLFCYLNIFNTFWIIEASISFDHGLSEMKNPLKDTESGLFPLPWEAASEDQWPAQDHCNGHSHWYLYTFFWSLFSFIAVLFWCS